MPNTLLAPRACGWGSEVQALGGRPGGAVTARVLPRSRRARARVQCPHGASEAPHPTSLPVAFFLHASLSWCRCGAVLPLLSGLEAGRPKGPPRERQSCKAGPDGDRHEQGAVVAGAQAPGPGMKF